MSTTIDLDGVHTWYEVYGQGEPLVALHPGGVDARALRPNVKALSEHFQVFTPERRGHGHTPDVPGPITHEQMAQDTILFLDRVVRGPARLVGVSDGAVVALLVALARPDLVERLVCAAGVFHRDGWLPQAIDPNAEIPQFIVSMYGEVSPDGVEHFPIVAKKLADTHQRSPALAPADLGKISARTLVMIGDDDQVTLEHALQFYRALPRGELAIVPGTSHGLLVEKTELCNRILLEFLLQEPVETRAPIRRLISN